VKLDRGPFVGQAALREEKRKGSPWALIGFEISWPALEELYERQGLPPSLPAATSREAIPIYYDGRQIGRATSHTWSPILKKYIGLATVRSAYATEGMQLQIEHTVEWTRYKVPCTVVKTPFFDPPRKRKP
jgi:aminomethyltransferase